MIDEKAAKKYCKDPTKIENYEKAVEDTTQTWHCHHRLETHNSDGERRLVDLTSKELKALGMYWHTPPEELIFLTSAEHNKLHMKGNQRGKGKHFSEEARKKISETHKGKKHSEEWVKKVAEANKGKKRGPLSGETKKKISDALKGRTPSEETRKRISEARKGKPHSEEWNKKVAEANRGKKHSAEARKKMSKALKGLAWWNNGTINRRSVECPEGFVPGKLPR